MYVCSSSSPKCGKMKSSYKMVFVSLYLFMFIYDYDSSVLWATNNIIPWSVAIAGTASMNPFVLWFVSRVYPSALRRPPYMQKSIIQTNACLGKTKLAAMNWKHVVGKFSL